MLGLFVFQDGATCLLVCLACLCFRVPGEQQEGSALFISLVLFVYWYAWRVCVSEYLESNRKV